MSFRVLSSLSTAAKPLAQAALRASRSHLALASGEIARRALSTAQQVPSALPKRSLTLVAPSARRLSAPFPSRQRTEICRYLPIKQLHGESCPDARVTGPERLSLERMAKLLSLKPSDILRIEWSPLPERSGDWGQKCVIILRPSVTEVDSKESPLHLMYRLGALGLPSHAFRNGRIMFWQGKRHEFDDGPNPLCFKESCQKVALCKVLGLDPFSFFIGSDYGFPTKYLQIRFYEDTRYGKLTKRVLETFQRRLNEHQLTITNYSLVDPQIHIDVAKGVTERLEDILYQIFDESSP